MKQIEEAMKLLGDKIIEDREKAGTKDKEYTAICTAQNHLILALQELEKIKCQN